MHKLFSSFLLLALGLTASHAQSVRWDPAGGQLGFNQVSELALVFDNCEPDGAPRLPTVDGLAVGRPSQSSQTSIVNFKMTQTFSLVYPVRPEKRTAINIPAFEIQTDKGTLKVPAATFTVGDATVGDSGLAVDEIASAQLTAPQGSVWAGEVFPVTYTLSVVRRYFHSLGSALEWPAAPLVAEEWTKPDASEVLIRGERRLVSIQRTKAYAKQPGTFTAQPAGQMVNLMVGTSGFGLFAQPTVDQQRIESESLELTVKPLPPAPANFSSAVGDFSFTSKVVPVTAAVGEPVTWTLELSGTGNWPDLAGLPQREVSNDFQVVQPKSKRTMKDGSLFDGTLTEDVVLVPTRPGTYQLAPVRFNYFDPKSGTYKSISSSPVTVTITAGTTPAAPPAGSRAPVQFSLNPPPDHPVAPELPTARSPVPPENLPRDPLTGSARGLVPFRPETFLLVVAGPAAGLVLLVWLTLAAFRSRERDPRRRRREARVALAAILTELRSATPAALAPLLRTWQQQAATLWEIPHAAPGSPLVHACVGRHAPDAAGAWSRLWLEADRTLHGRATGLPPDWMNRAEGALQAVQVRGWSPFSLFAPANLLPFLSRAGVWLVLLLSLSALPPSAFGAESADEAYRAGDFSTAEKQWQAAVKAAPNDGIARHNLGLALAQQDRWAEATAQWTGAFLLNSRAEATRWDLALGLQRSGLAPAELVEFSRGQGRYDLARRATPGEWQWILIGAALLLAAALVILLLQGYRRIGRWAKPGAAMVSVVAVLLAGAATFSLHTYGPLAHPAAVFVWQPTVLRSIPTEADTTQKSSPLSAGSIALAERTFLGWTKLQFTGGQTGWVRTEDLIPLYR